MSFDIVAGTCHAICGENGAGKSTLMKLLFGLERPDSGTILVDGVALAAHSPRRAAALGIGMVHQHFSLVASLTVAENVILGREPRSGPLIDRRAARDEVRRLAARYRLAVEPDAVVGRLSVAAQQKVEILKALARDVRLLILDEPTAVLTPQETGELFDRLHDLRAAGLTILFISHKLREVRALASHVTVLRAGAVTGDADLAALDDATIARLVMGRDVAPVRRAGTPLVAAPPVLVVQGLRLAASDAADRIEGIDFVLRAGEVLGIAGVEGNGQRGLVAVLTGLRRGDAGRLALFGRDVTRAGTARLRRLGMAHLPADRYRDGGARSLSLVDNAIAGREAEPPLARGPFVAAGAALRATQRMIAAFGVQARSAAQPLGDLSGGNAQKLIAARELARRPRLLIADQPTRGIDIEAAAFLRGRLLDLAARGGAVLLVSADIDELLALSDRILVLFGGRVAAEIDNGPDVTPERVGAPMLGLPWAA